MMIFSAEYLHKLFRMQRSIGNEKAKTFSNSISSAIFLCNDHIYDKYLSMEFVSLFAINTAIQCFIFIRNDV